MPDAMRPPARPELSRALAEELLAAHGVTDRVALLGRRGYYRDSMGRAGVNERGIYDDAIALVSPTEYRTFTANTDPSVTRPGMAVLVPGVYRYKVGIHGITKPPARRYPALVQAASVTIQRDGGIRATGWFGINIHRGSVHSTSSEGCQTIHPDQWAEFIALVEQELERHRCRDLPYVLTAREDVRT